MTIRPTSENLSNKPAALKDMSPAAQACANWFRKLARALKVCRLYKINNALVVQTREQVLGMLQQLVIEADGLSFRFTPSEIYLNN